MTSLRIFPVIMAGGASSRLWPASGKDRPKWDLRVAETDPQRGIKRTLLESTFARACAVAPAGDCLVVTAAAQADLIRRALPQLPAENILAEPQLRDTAGAVAFAAGEILRRLGGKEPVGTQFLMLVLPGDGVIAPVSRFAACVHAGAEAASGRRALVTFGIKPAYAATGYGYVHRGELLPGSDAAAPPVYRVQEFKEKPDRPTAESYLASGEYYWNAGIFLWPVDEYMSELERQLPLHAVFTRELARSGEGQGAQIVAKHYPGLTKISLDFGIMEHARTIATVESDFEWDDIGSWSSLGRHLEQRDGNAVDDETSLINLDSADNVVFAPGKKVALIGVHGLAIVESEGKILVCKLDRDQDVKKVKEQVVDE